MADTLHLGVLLQVIDDLEGVLDMPVDPEGQGLESLEEDERGDGRDCRSGVTEEDGSDPGHEGCVAECLIEADSVVAWVGLGQSGELSVTPVELVSLDDDSSEDGAVSSDELRS